MKENWKHSAEKNTALQPGADENQSGQPSVRNSWEEFDCMLDLIAHDMKSPIACISGFAEELSAQFAETGVSDEWNEYLSYVHRSAHSIDVVLEALLHLKLLHSKGPCEPEAVSLEEIVKSAASRYENFKYVQALELEYELNDLSVWTDPAIFEELVLILFRNFSNLMMPGEDSLRLCVRAERRHPDAVLVRFDANTRAMETEELSHILAPLQGRKRKRVKDADILLLCAQQMIAHLLINARAEHGAGDSLRVCLFFESKK